MLDELREDLKKYWRLDKSDFLQKFFITKDGPTKDVFRGVNVPNTRIIARKYRDLSLREVQQLLTSDIHEERLLALFIMVDQFKRGSDEVKKEIYDFYLAHIKYINHWDLVDSSADRIVGEYLKNKPRDILLKLAGSKIWWERRIAIMATYEFIKDLKEYKDTFKIAEILLHDEHDLIHKAVGWMLREVGKRVDQKVEEDFLKKHYKNMPRTMLRYAIERFPEPLRRQYLLGAV